MSGALLDAPPRPTPRKEGAQEFFADFGFFRDVVEEDVTIKGLPEAEPKAKKGDLVLRGYANTWVEDRDFEMVSRHAFDHTLKAYLQKNPIILNQHDHRQRIGQVAEGDTDDTGLKVTGYVRKPQEGEERWRLSLYNDIKAGIVRTMSIGGFFWRELIDGNVMVTDIDLFEISVVAVPSNPDSIFAAAAKAIKGGDVPGVASDIGKLLSQMRQIQGLEAMTDPMLLRLNARGLEGRYEILAADYRKATSNEAPLFGAWQGIVTATEAEALPAVMLARSADGLVRALYAVPTAGQAAGEGKAGRVLSKTNENKLRSAAEKIAAATADVQSVLDKLPANDDTED